jgi:hypothetical protein
VFGPIVQWLRIIGNNFDEYHRFVHDASYHLHAESHVKEWYIRSMSCVDVEDRIVKILYLSD